MLELRGRLRCKRKEHQQEEHVHEPAVERALEPGALISPPLLKIYHRAQHLARSNWLQPRCPGPRL